MVTVSALRRRGKARRSGLGGQILGGDVGKLFLREIEGGAVGDLGGGGAFTSLWQVAQESAGMTGTAPWQPAHSFFCITVC